MAGVNPLATDIGAGYGLITSGIGAVMIGWHRRRAKALR